MKRPAVAMSLATARREEFRLGFLRLRECKFCRDGDESVEFRIEPLDSPEHQLGHLNRRQLAFANKLPDLFDGSKREIAIAQAQNIFYCCRRFPNVPVFATMNAPRN